MVLVVLGVVLQMVLRLVGSGPHWRRHHDDIIRRVMVGAG